MKGLECLRNPAGLDRNKKNTRRLGQSLSGYARKRRHIPAHAESRMIFLLFMKKRRYLALR